MLGTWRGKSVIVGVLLLLLAVIIACGEEATEAPAPAAPDAAATSAAEVVTLPPSVTGATPAATPTAEPEAAAATPEPDDAMMAMKPEGVLDVGMANLGPYVATNYDAGYFQNRFAELVTHETLFVMGYDGEWEHRLVSGFDVSPDALTYTIRLQEGAKWHAGAESQGDWGDFNADDFIWSIGEIGKEGGKHVQRGNTERVFLCDGCSMTKIDEHTVELTRPEPTFQLTWFSQAPIPGFSMNSKVHYDTVGQDVALLEDVGTAPWEMVEHVTDVRRHMKAVENHWRHTPEFAEMIWHDIPEESTRLANFLAGELDTGIFNADSRQAIQDAIAAGTHPDGSSWSSRPPSSRCCGTRDCTTRLVSQRKRPLTTNTRRSVTTRKSWRCRHRDEFRQPPSLDLLQPRPRFSRVGAGAQGAHRYAAVHRP